MAWPPKIATAPPHKRPQTVYPTKGDRYHHSKRGSNYTIVGDVRVNHRFPDDMLPKDLCDGQMWVLYVSDDGVYSSRPVGEFMDGRFVRI